MFRFFFIIVSLFVGMYGIYWLFWSSSNILNTPSVSAQYDSLLTQALKRNTPESQKYEVTFITQDILGSYKRPQQNVSVKNNFLGKSIYSEVENQEIWTQNNFTYTTNGNCKWLIFDPCIILDTLDSTPSNLNLWGTPIYQKTSEISAAYAN